MKSKLYLLSLPVIILLTGLQACGIYSFTGSATAAKTIQVDAFFNNTDLGPANLGQTFTNQLKEYYQQNSSLNVVPENGELQIEGTIMEYRISPVAPVAGVSDVSTAALTRLTISVRVNYLDTLEPKNSFKDKSFSFFSDFPNTQDLSAVQEQLEKKIFDQIFIDIFNATVANW